MKIGYHNKAVSKKKRGSGEIGRRARFRGVWVKPCGFKSHLPHHRMRKPRNEVFLLVQRKQAELRYDQAPGLTDPFVLGNPDGLLQAVDKVDFSNRLCHTAFYIPHREPKKELF